MKRPWLQKSLPVPRMRETLVKTGHARDLLPQIRDYKVNYLRIGN